MVLKLSIRTSASPRREQSEISPITIGCKAEPPNLSFGGALNKPVTWYCISMTVPALKSWTDGQSVNSGAFKYKKDEN